MATIFVTTALDITHEERERLFDALDRSAGPAFENHHSLFLEQLPPENFRGSAGRTTILVMNPPYETGIEIRRTFAAAVRTEVTAALGEDKADTIDIIFRYHEDDEVGVDGVIRSDAKAAGQYS